MKKVATLKKAEDAIMIITFIIMVIASFAQDVNRNIVKIGISWFEELSRYCMVYMALLGAEAGLRDGTQLSIVAFTNMLKGAVQKIVLIIAKTITVIFSAVVFVTTVSLVIKQIQTGQVSPGLRVSMAVPYFALPLTFGIITLVQGVMLVQMIIDLFTNKSTKEA